MSDELVFYTHPMSRGRIVRWMLEEVGQPYRTEMLDYGTTMKAPEYLAVNPMGKVPAIRHGETVVTEAAAICAYLADAFPQAGLAPPPGDRRRGPYYRWLFFARRPGRGGGDRQVARLRGAGRAPSGMVGCGSVEAVMDALESAVSGRDYLAGDGFTAADVYVGAQIGWGMQFGTIEKRPAFERYWERISSRPAAVRAREIDDATDGGAGSRRRPARQPRHHIGYPYILA